MIDGRNLYNAARMRSFGFVYDSIGRVPTKEPVRTSGAG